MNNFLKWKKNNPLQKLVTLRKTMTLFVFFAFVIMLPYLFHVKVEASSNVGNVLVWTTNIDRFGSDARPYFPAVSKFYQDNHANVTTISKGHLSATSLDEISLLWVFLPYEDFTADDITYMSDFLATGGRIVFCGEHVGYFAQGNIYISRAVATLGGTFSVLAENSANPGGGLVSGSCIIRESNLTNGLTAYHYAAAAKMSYSGSTQVVVADLDKVPLVVDQAVGNGRITLFTDVNPWDYILNPYPNPNPSVSGNNEVLFLNLLTDAQANQTIVREGGNPNDGFGGSPSYTITAEPASYAPASTLKYTFTVEYKVANGSNATFSNGQFDDNDVTVKNANGISCTVHKDTSVGVGTGIISGAGTNDVVVQYTVNTPDGKWDSIDSGVYTIGIVNGAVKDSNNKQISGNPNASSFYITVSETAEITGVRVNGTAQVGETLSATVDPSGASVSYQWKADGSNVGTDKGIYTVQDSDLGKTITVTVTGTGIYTGEVTSTATSVVIAGKTPITSVSIVDAEEIEVGQTLTATIAPSEATVVYQWKASGINVGSNSATYTVQAGDIGKTITVTATGTDNYKGKLTSTATSTITAARTPLTNVSIGGVALLGQTLTATVTPSGATATYQWQADGIDVGTNATTYTVQAADMGKKITVTAIGTGNYKGTVTSTATSEVTAAITVRINNGAEIGGANLSGAIGSTPISSITSIVVTGGIVTTNDWNYIRNLTSLTDLKVENTVSTVADIPSYNGNFIFPNSLKTADIAKAAKISYAAFYNCTNLTKLTLAGASIIDTYALNGCSSLVTLKLPATPPTVITNVFAGCPTNRYLNFINEDGNDLSGEDLTSAQNAYKAANDGNVNDTLWFGWRILPPTPITSVTISGTARVGEILTAITAPSTATVTYQWKANGINVGTGTANYTVQAADFGKTITVTVTGTGEYSGTITSEATNAVIAAKTPINAVTIGGTAQVGEILTATVYPNEATVTYQWKANGSDVGTNSSTYTVQPDDLGKRISVTVTGIDDYKGVATSNSTYYVIAAKIPITNVSISGIAMLGQNLTATITPSGATATYQWQADGANVGTNAMNYTVQAADLGKTITVTATGTGNYKGTISSTATSEVIAAITIKINNGAEIGGASLSGTIGGTPINSITSLVITGGIITTNDWNYIRNLTSLTDFKVVNTVSTVADIPNFNGSFIFPNSLRTVDLAKTMNISYAAFYNCTNLITGIFPDATKIETHAFNGCSGLENLKLPAIPPTVINNIFTGCPINRYLSFIDANGNELTQDELISAQNAYKAVNDGNMNDSFWYGWRIVPQISITSVSISGTSQVGETLLAAVAPNDAAVTYQWKANGTVVGTDATYTVQASDIGKTITVTATGTGDYTGTVTSSATSEVIAAKTPITAVTINGTAQVGETLSAIVAPNDATVTYQWKADGNVVGTDATYTVQVSDIGKTITVTATGTGEYKGTVTSAATSEVIAAKTPITAVTINGTAQVGETLSAAVAPNDATVTYQWKANGAVVGTDATYTVQASDIGKTITITATGTGDYSGSITSSATSEVIAAKTPITAVTINGTAQVGETLTATVVPNDATVTYQWKANGTIVGTDATYTVQAADIGRTITVTATGTGDFAGIVTSSATSEVIAAKTQITAVIINGTAQVGQTLSAVVAPNDATVTYVWKANGTVAGTDATYTVQATDIGKTITVTATGTGDYTGTVISAATSVVIAAKTPITAVTINGTAQVGETLTTIVVPNDATITYQWKANGTVVGTDATYTVQAADLGKTITITATGTGDYSGSITSAATSEVIAAKTPITAVTINGTTQVGETLTATVIPNDVTAIYQWKADGTVVGTDATYKVQASDIGKTITVTATGTGDYSGSITSAATSEVIATKTPITAVTISGTAQVGETLSAAVAPNDATVTYLWKADGTVVGSDAAYIVKVSDIGKTITVTATGTGTYSGSVTSSETSEVTPITIPATPLNAVSVSGSAIVGETLTAAVTPNDATVTYQWKANGEIVGTDSFYSIQISDIGKTITVTVTGTGHYAGTVVSPATSEVIAGTIPPVTTYITAVSVSGSAIVGELLTAKVTPSDATAIYQWKADQTVVGTDSTYIIKETDLGKAITVTVTGVGEYAGTVTSPATSTVIAGTTPPPVKTPITSVSIHGKVLEGETLIAMVTPNGATVLYQWKVNGENVGNDATYTVKATDIGKTITVMVTGTGNYSNTVWGELKKSDLDKAKAAARAKVEQDYTVNSWKILKDALALPENTNEEVLAKIAAIYDSIAKLVNVNAPTNSYSITGEIKDSNHNPVSGATVILTDTTDATKTYSGTTDANGTYIITGVPNGTYTITVIKNNVNLGNGNITVNGSNVSGGSGNITITPPVATTHTVTGTIKDINNNPISGATVILKDTTDGTKTFSSITDVNGNYIITGVPNGTYSIIVTKNGVTIGNGNITLNGSNVSGGSGNITVTPTTPIPMQPTTPTPIVEQITIDVKQGNTDHTISKITIERVTDEKGNKSDRVTYEEEKAEETIKTLKEQGSDVARIVIPDTKDEITQSTINVPLDTLDTLAKGDINIQIDTAKAKIDIPKQSLQNANNNMKETLYFNLVPITDDEQKQEIKERAIFNLGILDGSKKNDEINVKLISEPITIETNMPSSAVDITLPLTGISIPTDPADRETFLNQLAVYIEHSDGDKELVRGEIVEYKQGILGIRFHIMKFSIFTIVQSDSFVKSSKCDITNIIEPSEVVISRNNITTTVENTSTTLTPKVTVSDKASWKLYSDKACTKSFKDNTMLLKVGTNKAYLKVIAEDGTTKTYTMTITRNKSAACDITKVEAPSKASIKGKMISATVINSTTSSVLKITVSDKATWKLYSDKQCKKELTNQKLKLKDGINKVYIKVTAEDGTTTKVFTLTITRQEASKKVIIVATKYDFTDAFAGAVLAGQLGGNVICTGISDQDVKEMLAYIKKNYSKQDEIYIIGLDQAVNGNLDKMLKKEGYTNIIRIGGEDKYETAKLIADNMKLSEKIKVVLVNGEIMPKDAKYIQKICAASGYPILFVETDKLTTHTIEALKEIKPTQIYLIGDKLQISTKVIKEIGKETGLDIKNIIRISRSNEIK